MSAVDVRSIVDGLRQAQEIVRAHRLARMEVPVTIGMSEGHIATARLEVSMLEEHEKQLRTAAYLMEHLAHFSFFSRAVAKAVTP